MRNRTADVQRGDCPQKKEEVIQGAISQMTQNLTYGAGNPLFSTEDEKAIINPGRALEEFAGGAVVGGVLGGGQIGVDAAVNRIANRLPTAGDVAQGNKKTASTGEAALPKMSMADFTDVHSPVWNNVEYGDTERRSAIQSQTHQNMVEEGRVVRIPENTRAQVGENFPDLRTMKKQERTPILKQKMDELKRALRGVLAPLKSGGYEFEVNGNVLEAKLYDTGIREVMEKITQDKAAMLHHSDEVFRSARYLYSTPDYEGDSNIYRWNYFYTPVEIGGETVGVRIAVRDIVKDALGNPESQIYNWGIKKDAPLDGEGRGISRSSHGISSGTSVEAPLDGGEPGQMPNITGVSSSASSAPIIASEVKKGKSKFAREDGGILLPRAGEAVTEDVLLPRGGEAALAEDAKPEHLTDKEWAMWKKSRKNAPHSGYLGTPATDKLGIRIEKPAMELGAAISLRGQKEALRSLGKKLDDAIWETRATEGEKSFAQDVAAGKYSMEDTPMTMNMKTVNELVDHYRAIKGLKEKKGSAYLAAKRDVLDERVAQLIRNSDAHKAPSVLSMNANTMQRNNLRTFGPEEGAAINGEYFDPVLVNEAERLRFVNRMYERVRSLDLTEQESALVQKVMEKELDRGKMPEGVDAVKIVRAAKEYRELYNDLYEAINDFLPAHGYDTIGFQKDYAPHQQEEAVAGKLQRLFKSMGFDTTVKELPTSIAGRTEDFKPGKQYNPYFQHRIGNETEYDAVGGLESYLDYISKVFYHTDDIMKLRRYVEGLRKKYTPEEILQERDHVLFNMERNTEEGATQEADAWERFDNMSEYGGYVTAVEDYTNVLAGKQTKFDRAFENLLGRKVLNFGKEVQKVFGQSTILGNLSSAINQTVQLPMVVAETSPEFVARAIRDVADGTLEKSKFNLESDFVTGKRGVVPLSKATKQMDKLMDKAAIPFEFVDEWASQVVVRAKYLQEVSQGKAHKEAIRAADDFANRVVGSRMKGARPLVFEHKNPLSKLVTTFQLEIANGLAHVTQDIPAEIRAIAKAEGTPAAAKRVAWLFMVSQVGAFLMNQLLKEIDGQEPVPFDGIGLLTGMISAGYGMSEKQLLQKITEQGGLPTAEDFNMMEAMKNAGEDALENVPYASNLGALLGITDGRLPLPNVKPGIQKVGGGIGTMLEAGKETDPEERRKLMGAGAMEVGHGAALSAANVLPMGNQIRKTAQGAAALARGGYYTGYGENERLQYTVEPTPANIARGLLFGRSAMAETGEYYDNNGRAFGTEQTKVIDGAAEQGIPRAVAAEIVSGFREESGATSKRTALLFREDLTPAQKRWMSRELGLGDYDYTDQGTFAFSGLSGAKQKRYFSLVTEYPFMDKKTYADIIDYVGASPGKETGMKSLRMLGFSDEKADMLYRYIYG